MTPIDKGVYFCIHKNNRLGDKKVNESNEIKIAKMEKDIDRVETNSKSWWKEMKEDVAEIKTQLQNLPDVIICRLQENTDLKIQTKVQELENKINEKESATYRWIIGIGVGLIITMTGTIVSIVIQVAL